MGLVLDTSIIISVEKKNFDMVYFLEEVAGMEDIYLTTITASELLNGVERANTPMRKKLRSQFVEKVLEEFPILGFGLPEARVHAHLWAELAKKGEMIRAHDLVIAAIVLANNHQLATLNEKEFKRIRGLKLWCLTNNKGRKVSHSTKK